jgi:hypothetical protein
MMTILPAGHLLHQGHIVLCDFPDKFHIGIVEQDVKVLDGMDGLEGLPILKPNDLHSTVNWGQRLAYLPTKIWK